jgi:hypothetical protein
MTTRKCQILIASSLLCLASCNLLSTSNNEKTLSVQSSNAQYPERLFLQQVTSHSAIIKWRGEHTKACVKSSSEAQRCISAALTEGQHYEAHFTDLQSNTAYSYSVGSYKNANLRFQTAPVTGSIPPNGKTRLWILGDSGTASEIDKQGNKPYKDDAQAVMDGFIQYNRQQPLDLILLLGDNAYMEGSDAQWQTAVFDLYRPLLAQSALWPTIGNHEMGLSTINIPDHGPFTHGGISTSDSPNSYYTADDSTPRRMPYLDIFTLPSRGEAGGIASGTEQYYSFDYGNLHIVSLDSQLSMRNPSQRATMRNWLINDLNSNQQDWTIVIFHHPPYTKGSHDSDKVASLKFSIDQPIITVREEFTPLFENYGVDMVYSGHSHSYERSYYLNGHRGDASSFDAKKHAELTAAGQLANGQNDQVYQQISPASQLDDKVVYTVAGSAGKVDLGKGKLDHPAHAIQVNDPQQRHGLAALGSVVLEANHHELTALFINTQGKVLDTVTLQR